MALELRPEQQQVVDDISTAFRAGYKRIMVSAACGFGKCHGKGTMVIMADGSIKAVEDVVVGDRLLSPTSTPRTVLSLGRGREEMYRVMPVKGDSYTVNSSHLLSLKLSAARSAILSNGQRVKKGETIAIDVPTFLSSNATARKSLVGWRSGVVEFETQKQPLSVPPYVLGAWLGDGSLNHPAITKPECKMVEEWASWGEGLGCTTHRNTYGDKCQSVRLTTERGQINPVTDKLRSIGVMANKHVPDQYLTASYFDRMELISGLLDSDGYTASGGYEFISKHELLANQFAFLCRSVGLACYVKPVKKGIASTGFVGDYWLCSVSGDCERVPCRDKPARPRTINKNHLVTGISCIYPIGIDDYYGFELDGDHLYLLEDFTVCHNTELATAILMAAKKNNKRSGFLADRISLCTQTSERFDKYGLDHGIVQGDHWRTKPSELVQVCSVQTLAKRRQWPEMSLVVVDEAHVLNEAVKTKLAAKDCYAIGLSATAVTPGLGKYFDFVVNAPTTNRLIEMKRLVPLRYFACTAPDMTDVKVVAGEWSPKETDKRVLQVVGDVVKEYLENGQGKKFIGFAASIAHAQELQRQFIASGINVATYTADDKPEDRSEIVQEFKKADSSIRGILSVEALTRGFDVASVEVLILARPLRSALAVHVQMLGRVMRTSDGKEEAIVLDHSGNVARFWKEVNELFENGVTELDDGKKKEKPKALEKDEEKEMVKCPQCRAMHMPRPSCPSCGHEYPRKKAIEHVPGTLKELVATGNPSLMKKMLWPQVCALVLESSSDMDRAQRRAQAIYHELTGTFAMGRVENTTPEAPTPELRAKVKANQIQFIKGKQAGARHQEAVAA